MKVKLYTTLICSLLSIDLQAQQDWEYVNSQFGTWQIEQGLYATNNSLEKLNIKNTTSERIANAQNNLNYRSALLNMSWKENNSFEISFTLSNEKTTPYQYGQEQVYWGLSLELYKTDGSIVSKKLWLSADRYESVSEGEVASRYSYSANNEGWKKWTYSGEFIKKMDVKITCYGNSLSAGFEYYPDKSTYYSYKRNQSFATHSNIAGIKSISVIVGSGAEISVTDFFSKRKSLYSTVKPFIEKGDEYMQKEIYDSAIGEYTNAINKGYQNADIYMKRAAASTMKNFNTSAIEDCNKALSYDSNNEYAYYIRGISKLKNNDDSGVSDLRKAGEDGIAFLREFGLLDYYPNQNNSGNSNTQKQQRTSIPQNVLKKDPNFKIK